MTEPTVTFDASATAIDHFRLLYCRFTLKATTPLHLPPYKGSAFRGGFGHALKQMACTAPEKICDTCEQPNRCIYAYLFETKIEQTGANEEMIPRPFVLVPPLEAYREYAPGDVMTCDLVLTGDAMEYLPYFIAGLNQLGHQGIGKSMGRYTITAVHCLRPNAPAYELYCGPENRFEDLRAPTTGGELAMQYRDASPQHLTLSLITPTRLKYQGHLLKQAPPFHVIARRLLDRIAELSLFFHDTPLALDIRAWKHASEAIRLVESHVTPYDWERYSSRQRTRMKLDGVVGTATYAGDLAPFLPLLSLGEWLNVGKGATFGLGKYQIADMA
ncbi:CRISPR system precrRNA processing endoribonuclease RAMP protein Cas6 [Candidatus Entotheonella palauensis]|uniref:CRISPR system precrRNA processing endoribonuclease RAMP protein Cas6 n=1 Tax=Candidatus Entotheonella palauensis TaxID=93172 RepID=UPI000B7EBC99|nr:CRISPR system precrRNA processing endoribonuclease RAMP protein Cas6 [Candidatus Entotheonella palauensis]